MEEKFREIFEKSPIGIVFFDREGNLTDANQSALEIGGVPSLNEVKGINLFNSVNISPNELAEKGHIKIQTPVNFDNIKKSGIYNSTRSGTAFIDLTISIIDSGFLVQMQDITEHKKAKKTLEESKEKFSKVFHANPAAMTLSDRKGKWLDVNKSFSNLTGYSRDELIGHTSAELNIISTEKKDQAYKELKEKGIRPAKEHEIKTKSGEKRVIISSSEPIELEGKLRFVSFIYDITERKKVEETLKESERKYREWFEGDLTGDFVATPDGKLIECNPTYLDIYGFKNRSMALQYNISQFNTEAWTGLIVLLKDKRIIKGRQSRHKRPDGKMIHVIANAVGVFNESDELTEIRGYVFDDTERKKAEEKLKKAYDTLELKVQERTDELEKAYESLKESEEKFREIFNKANDMITLVELGENGLPGRFLDVNDIAPKRLGYSKQEFSKMSTAEIINPEYRPQMAENAKNLMKNGHARFEIVNVDKWGTKIPVEVSVHIFKLRGKNVILAISHDIRERKQAEKQLKETIKELERSNKELEQFAYVSSHDLQEPLRTIASFTQLLEMRYKGKFDSDADEFMDFIVEAAVRMKAQIEGLLEYSRVGTKGKEFKPVDMNKILKSTTKVLNTSIEESKAKITFDELPTIMGDADQLQRVFQNLISNAIRFRKCEETTYNPFIL